MKTIRRKVFETNSSTTHCVTFTKKYENLYAVPLRDVSEFPALNANNELEIELDVFWDMDVIDNPNLDFTKVGAIIKYLCAQSVFSSQETLFSRRNHEIRNHFDDNHKAFLKDLQDAYSIMGLTVPIDVKPYVLDINDNKIYVTKDNLFKWFCPFDEQTWYSTKKDWKESIKKQIEVNPEAKNWPYLKHYIGVCGNDLCCNSYDNATSYYTDFTNGYECWEDNNNNKVDDSFENITTVDVLTRQINLSFYHT